MFIPGVLRVAVCCLRGAAGWAAALGLAGRRGAPEGQPTALFVQSTSAVSVAGVWSDATTTTTKKTQWPGDNVVFAKRRCLHVASSK